MTMRMPSTRLKMLKNWESCLLTTISKKPLGKSGRSIAATGGPAHAPERTPALVKHPESSHRGR
jgi:hypothetical protein